MARSLSPRPTTFLYSFKRPNNTYLLTGIFLLLSFYYLYHTPRRVTCTPRPEFQSHKKLASLPGTFDGEWNTTRDSHNLLLTDSQCGDAFMGLYEEVERPLALRRNDLITLGEIDRIKPKKGYVRCLLYDQKVRTSLVSRHHFSDKSMLTINF